MATYANRFVVGPDAQNRSAVLQRGLTNVRSREGFYRNATLWGTEETPVDNTIDGDRSQTPGLGESLQPFPKGLICRALCVAHSDATRSGIRYRPGLAAHRLRRCLAYLGRYAAANHPVRVNPHLLGHSSISITGHMYGHTSDATTRAAIDGLTSALRL